MAVLGRSGTTFCIKPSKLVLTRITWLFLTNTIICHSDLFHVALAVEPIGHPVTSFRFYNTSFSNRSSRYFISLLQYKSEHRAFTFHVSKMVVKNRLLVL